MILNSHYYINLRIYEYFENTFNLFKIKIQFKHRSCSLIQLLLLDKTPILRTDGKLIVIASGQLVLLL